MFPYIYTYSLTSICQQELLPEVPDAENHENQKMLTLQRDENLKRAENPERAESPENPDPENKDLGFMSYDFNDSNYV